MVFGSTVKIPPGDYLIINGDQSGDQGTYLSFFGRVAAMCKGPLYHFFANYLLMSGKKAIIWRVSYPPQFPDGQFGLQCVWMGPKGRGNCNYGKVVTVSSFGRFKLVADKPPSPFTAFKVDGQSSGKYYIEVVDTDTKDRERREESETKFLYGAGTKVFASKQNKSIWKFVKIGEDD